MSAVILTPQGVFMKKKTLFFIALTLFFNVSAFVYSQDAVGSEASKKPSKEDFFHTWGTERIEAKTKYTIDITFKNELSYVSVLTFNKRKTVQNYLISSWEEMTNTYKDAEEYPCGFKISAKEDNNRSYDVFAMFINADKTKFLCVMDLGFYTQYDIYTKK